MITRITRLALASIAILLTLSDGAMAQRGRGGGGGRPGGGGGGGMVGRPGGGGGGGGMVGRPGGGGGNFARPSMPQQNFNRPSMPQQNFNRPSMPQQNFNRPSQPQQNFNRPTNINQSINRPTNLNQNNFNRTNLNQNNVNRTNLNQNNVNRTNLNQNNFGQSNINNRANFGGNTVVNNITNVNRGNYAGNLNRGGYGGYGGSYGGYGGGNRNWGGNAFYGSGVHGGSYYGYHSNWVNGSWGGNYRPGWGGYPAYGYGGYGGYGSGYGYGNNVGYGIGAAALGIGAGLGIASWGLGSLYNNWGYSQYSNPYYASAYSAQPANFAVQSLGYDYSMPLNLSTPPPDEPVIQASVASLDSAREAFHAGDYPQALALADQALKQTPNDPMLHEFRATCLFALARYDEAAVPMYTVLSAGPGWDWTTLIGLYPDIDTYTTQLRALEGFCNTNPQAASARFVLASLYLTQGSKDAAAARLQQVVAIQPQDRLSAQLLQALASEAQAGLAGDPNQPAGQPLLAPARPIGDIPPADPVPAQAAIANAPAGANAAAGGSQAPPLPVGPVPANLLGAWTASPAQGVDITMNLVDDKSFSWKVVEKGKAREFKGDATFDKDVLALNSPDLPPMVAKVTTKDGAHFNFKAVGAPAEDPGLNFAR